MNILASIKSSSIRTKFIFFTLSVFAITNIFIAIFYPSSEFDKEFNRLQFHYLLEIERIVANNSEKQGNYEDYDEVFIANLFASLESLPDVVYISTQYLGKKYSYPADIFSYDLIQTFEIDKITENKNRHILSLNIPVQIKQTIGIINLNLGLNADGILAAETRGRYLTLILLLISAFIIYLFIFFFDRVIYTPFKKLINISRLISIGQDSLEETDDVSQEFNQISAYLEVAAKRMNELKQDIKLIPLSLRKSQDKAARIQKDLDREIEAMSSLIIYILELRKEHSQESIYINLTNEVTMQLGYSICFLFKFENNKLIYHKSNLKGLKVIDEKLKTDLSGYVITDQHQIVKEMQKHNPIIVSKLPFDEKMQKYNLLGQYALIPISTAANFYGMMIVGKMGEEKTIQHKELEKLMLLCNTVGLHLDNLNSMAILERSVEQRTSELEITNKLLSNAITEKDTMLTLVSHDLNAPLRNVIGLVESIQRKHKQGMDKDLADRLARIKKNMEKELNMIDEILTSFKTEETVDLSQNIDIKKLVESILDELTYELNRKNIKVFLDEKLPIFVSNQAIMKHIFLNLIDNACKYIPFKNVGNEIRVSYSEDNGSCIFQVSDNGLGIPKEKQEFIFNSYQKAGSSPDESAGKGLGLALVKNMVGKVKGEISFASTENKGTTFYLRFNNYNEN